MKYKQRKRHEAILLSLKKLDYLTTSQIQRLHGLKSERNAQRVLKEMSEYLNVERDGENIYYLNAKGRDVVGSQKVRRKLTTYQHYIMRNYIYITYLRPATWKNEMKISHKGVTCIADATFEMNKQLHIVEVDHTQDMIKNRRKIERYKELIDSGGLVNPKFVWITTTDYRQKELLRLTMDLPKRIYCLDDLIGGVKRVQT